MDDLVVLLDRRDITAGMEGQVLRVERPDCRPERIPLKLISQVVVYGSPMVSCDVWRKLADAGIPAVLFPGRGPGGPACLGSGLSSAVMIRIAQHRAAANPQSRTTVARHIVSRKLRMQEKLLALLAKDDNVLLAASARHRAKAEFAAVSDSICQCRSAVKQAPDPDQARGYEGAAATAWFGFLADILPGKWRFNGRNRRPPRDPVNGLLSLSYTMALAEVRQVVQQRGLDPGIGFLHTPRPGRESLLLDLLEPCRPAVDAFVLELINGLLAPGHFTYSKKYGCRLNKEGRSIYYRQWADRRLNWPQLRPEPEDCEEKGDKKKQGVRLQYAIWQVMQETVDIWRQLDDGDGVWETC